MKLIFETDKKEPRLMYFSEIPVGSVFKVKEGYFYYLKLDLDHCVSSEGSVYHSMGFSSNKIYLTVDVNKITIEL